ncbi:MAG: hypothetical protein ACTHOH_07910 [Lysobacteraceae bacterium]
MTLPKPSQSATWLLALLLLAGLLPAGLRPAHAEGNCPPGMFPIGGGNAGWVGCAPMGPGSGDGGDDAPPPPAWRPLSAAEQAQQDQYLREGAEAGRRLREGAWDVAAPTDAARAPAACEVRFSKMGESVSLRGPAPGDTHAVLTFGGKKIPHPRKPEKIRVTLMQSGDADQTVEAYSYTLPGLSGAYSGALSFAIPGVDALLSSMQDVQGFRIRQRGRTLASLQWQDGLAARDRLARCLRGR